MKNELQVRMIFIYKEIGHRNMNDLYSQEN